jgi:hypothetical protein
MSVKLLATKGRLVDVEVFSIKNFNLLITNFLYSKPVDKIEDKWEIISPDYQFFTEIGAFDYHIKTAGRNGKRLPCVAFFHFNNYFSN